MKKDILDGAVRHTQEKGLRRARVGYIPLQQCGYSDYSEYGRAQAEKFDALVALDVIDLVAMPTIEDFARMYINEKNGDRFFFHQRAPTILLLAKNGLAWFFFVGEGPSPQHGFVFGVE